jgi:hypothetical protein
MLQRMRGFLIASILGATVIVACSGSQPKTDPSALTLEEFEEGQAEAEEPKEYDPYQEAPEPGEDECRSECMSDEDCCDGYFCGKDPERSQRQNYCMPE